MITAFKGEFSSSVGDRLDLCLETALRCKTHLQQQSDRDRAILTDRCKHSTREEVFQAEGHMLMLVPVRAEETEEGGMYLLPPLLHWFIYIYIIHCIV